MIDIYKIINLAKDCENFTHFYLFLGKKNVKLQRPPTFEMTLRKTLDLFSLTKMERDFKNEEVIMEAILDSKKPNYFWFTSGKDGEQPLYYLFISQQLKIDENWKDFHIQEFEIDDTFRTYIFYTLLSEEIKKSDFGTKNALYF